MNTKHDYLPTRITPTLAPFRFTIAPPSSGRHPDHLPQKKKSPNGDCDRCRSCRAAPPVKAGPSGPVVPGSPALDYETFTSSRRVLPFGLPGRRRQRFR
jgi:hypothetical protein